VVTQYLGNSLLANLGRTTWVKPWTPWLSVRPDFFGVPVAKKNPNDF